MSSAKTFSVGKVDAARRHLEASLLLYFNEADPVPAYLLASAAHELLRDLAAKSGSSMFIEEQLRAYFDEDKIAEIRRAWVKPYNFLKHADRDPDALSEFSADWLDGVLFDSVLKFTELTGERPLLLRVYETWFIVHNRDRWRLDAPEIPEDLKQLGAALRSPAGEEIASMPRRRFMRECLKYLVTL